MLLYNCFHAVTTRLILFIFFFFFNDTATTEIYTLSLHDALPIWLTRCCSHERQADRACAHCGTGGCIGRREESRAAGPPEDRKSTRLNSSHLVISYAVFCLKKKKPFATHPGLH